MKQMCPVPPDSGLKPVLGSSAPSIYQLWQVSGDRNTHARRLHRQYGDMTFLNVFGRKMLSPLTPGAVERVVMNKDRAFANEPAWDHLIGLAFRRGILLMDFEEHRHHRLILQQAFTPMNLQGYMKEMQPFITERVRALPTGHIRLADEIKQIALDMALSVFVGVDLPRERANTLNKAFLDCVDGMRALVRRPIPGGKWKRTIAGRAVLEEFFYSLIPQKRAHQTPDLFSVLCHAQSDDGDVFTDDDVVNHMIFVLFAAHDTSTTTMATMAYYMGKDPTWQQRARAEALELPESLEYDDLKKMGSLDLVLKESVRLNAPVPMLAREALVDTEVEGYYVPKGTMVLITPASIHLNPDVWNDPDTFDPERFLPGRAEDKAHRFAWFPFGGGVHKCIGLYFAQMEIKTLLHQLLRQYEWTVDPSYTMTTRRGTLGEPSRGLPVSLAETSR